MKNKIQHWIQTGANALEGVQLIKEACAPSIVLRLVKAAPEANRVFMIRWLSNKYHIESCQPKAALIEDSEKPFREEFPFLNRADCPPELEQLASRKFARYHSYVSLHKKLRSCASLDECRKTSRQLINDYIENRMIWDELNYYKEHGSLLGKHPIFIAFKRRKEMLDMNVKQLMKRQQQVVNNIWRVKSELKKGNKPHLEAERLARLHEYEAELAEIIRLLDG